MSTSTNNNSKLFIFDSPFMGEESFNKLLPCEHGGVRGTVVITHGGNVSPLVGEANWVISCFYRGEKSPWGQENQWRKICYASSLVGNTKVFFTLDNFSYEELYREAIRERRNPLIEYNKNSEMRAKCLRFIVTMCLYSDRQPEEAACLWMAAKRHENPNMSWADLSYPVAQVFKNSTEFRKMID